MADYANLSILEALELPMDVFLLYLRDSFIFHCRKSQSGMEYLENCWDLEQTEPDRKRLRNQYGKEAE